LFFIFLLRPTESPLKRALGENRILNGLELSCKKPRKEQDFKWIGAFLKEPQKIKFSGPFKSRTFEGLE
jgi:hypothetical protein